jgi:hypothetical protein
MLGKLRDTLEAVRVRAGDKFSGIGLIVSDAPELLPLFPIKVLENRMPDIELTDFLAEISTLASDYHDGFHVISSDWRVSRVAQYFSPPILKTVKINRSKRFGGRYLAALFGSALSPVKATGIASSDFGVAVFERGVEVIYQRSL